MSAYPPPPPPPPPGAAGPYDRNAAKAQRQAWQAQQKAWAAGQKQQARFQRQQLRMQARAARRGSLVGPVLLVTLGVVFLLTQTGKLTWIHVAAWYGHWWPAVLIVAGLLLIAEWTVVRERQNAGVPVATPALGGGLVFLLILLAVLGIGMGHIDEHFANQYWFGPNFGRMLGEAHSYDDAVANSIAPGQGLLIRCPQGDVTVTGDSADGQVHVNIHKQVHAWSESDAESRQRKLAPNFSTEAGQLVLTMGSIDGGQSDLTVEIPHDTPVTIEDGRGDITVNQVHAPLNLTASRGSVDLSGITGTVAVHMNDDDGSVNGHSMTGAVTVQGRSGDINFTDIAGPVTLQGDFFGATHLERVSSVVRFQTSRTDFEAQRLDGSFEVDTGADLQANQVVGPVKLITRNRNIELDRVSGHVEIANRNGSVTVTNAPPFAGLQITNDRGSVDVGVPPSAAFTLNATTRHGDIENDFGLNHTGTTENSSLNGTVGSGGPLVSISTSNGDITVRKSTVAPLPPEPPAPPKLTAPESPSSAGEAIPKVPKTPKVPRVPKVPEVPAVPASPTTP